MVGQLLANVMALSTAGRSPPLLIPLTWAERGQQHQHIIPHAAAQAQTEGHQWGHTHRGIGALPQRLLLHQERRQAIDGGQQQAAGESHQAPQPFHQLTSDPLPATTAADPS